MKQIISGLLYLHSHKILHRDLTLANLLLTKDMKVVSDGFQKNYQFHKHLLFHSRFSLILQKIADFGLATRIEPGEDHTTMCGTPNYISP